MADIFLGSDGDDTLVRSQWYYPGQSPSVYTGLLGYDTLNFSAVPGGMTYFYGRISWVQDRTIPFGFYDETIGQDIYAYAWISGWDHVIAGEGNDTFYLLDDVDYYDAGAGIDTFIFTGGFEDASHLDGNLGDDILDFSDDVQGFTYDLNAGTLTNYRDWVATISSVENIFAGSADDVLIPGADTLYMHGGDGDDTFDVGAGVLIPGMLFIGGDGTDTFGFSGLTSGLVVDLALGLAQWGDTLSGYAFVYEFENVTGGRSADTIIGTDSRNDIFGGSGDDLIDGAGGRDYLYGQGGDDTILGGAGNDRIYGQNGDDDLRGGAGQDKIFGGKGDDTLRGGGGDDKLVAGKGNDVLQGGRGDDQLRGGQGDDLLIGGRGDDVLIGGTEADIFRFADDHGNDTILDFDVSDPGELVDFRRVSDISSMAELNAAAVDTADGVLITTGATSSVLLAGVLEASLSQTDFMFV